MHDTDIKPGDIVRFIKAYRTPSTTFANNILCLEAHSPNEVLRSDLVMRFLLPNNTTMVVLKDDVNRYNVKFFLVFCNRTQKLAFVIQDQVELAGV